MGPNYATSERLVLAHEGGYVNNPKDPGGPTNKGITQRVYDAWRTNQGLKPQDVRQISDDEVAAIYRSQYWNEVRGDALPSGLDYAVFDYAVNSGPAQALKDLQRTVGAAVDGKYGNMTAVDVGAAYKADPIGLITAYQQRRLAFMKSLKQWSAFKNGWTRRVNEVMVNAKAIAAAAPVTTPTQILAGTAAPTGAQVLSGDLQPVGVAGTPALITPAPIGAYLGEQGGKALPTQQLFHRTFEGLGHILAACGGAGAIGQQALDAVDPIKGQIGDSPIGRLAMVATVILILVGAGLIIAAKLKDFKEAAGTAPKAG